MLKDKSCRQLSMPWINSLYYIQNRLRFDPLQVKVKQHQIVKHLPGFQMISGTRMNDYSMSNGQMNSPFDKCFAHGIQGFNFFSARRSVLNQRQKF